MVDAVIALLLLASQHEDQLFELLALGVALVWAGCDDGAVSLTVDTVLDFVADTVVDGVIGLDVEADGSIVWADRAAILRYSVRNGRTLGVNDGVVGGSGHNGDGEEESCN